MYSQETLEYYKRMTNSERLAVTLKMIDEQFPYLQKGPPEVVARRFELLRRENDLRNKAMLECIARSKEPS